MQTIGPSNSISKTIDKVGALLSRKTQRKLARGSSIIPPPTANAGVVIDVRVESATVEADSDPDKFRYSTVHADEVQPVIRRAPWFGMPSSVGSGSIATKAKGLTQKFRQRSKPELSNSETVD
jgi:hypothetical protein